ncbi:MAG: hypothetical protein ACE5RN_00885 [Nitrosopumilaceae archaeon]
MVLTDKEKTIAIISNAIAGYSLMTEKGSLPENTSLIDFILKMTPNELKSIISINLIDEVFEYISKVRMDDS